jgi:hypothetical protein
MELLIMMFSLLPFYIVPLRPKYSDQHHTLSILFSFLGILLKADTSLGNDSSYQSRVAEQSRLQR